MAPLTWQDCASKPGALPRYSRIYRSREVGQSYVTSVVTTLIATAHAFWLVFRIRPNLVCTSACLVFNAYREIL